MVELQEASFPKYLKDDIDKIVLNNIVSYWRKCGEAVIHLER